MDEPRNDEGVFHEGELRVQQAFGERAQAQRNARMVGDAVPAGAAAFLAQQRMLVLASLDDTGSPWVSLVFGEPGFASASDRGTVRIDRTLTRFLAGDALLANLRVGAMLGLLAIDLGSRARFRVNGTIASSDEERIDLRVREAFGNCPKYIQRRRMIETEHAPRGDAGVFRGERLDPARQALIRRADTMFVASRHPARGADASHRGGEPGFLEIVDDRTIRVPEYPGNGMHNTLGNLVVAREAGLAILDFEGGRLLQLSGSATVALAPNPRSWDFTVARWTELALPETLRWELLERSPFNPPPRV